MRRILTTLMILLVVVVAGLSALVLLVNPNDFRAYLVGQVAARNGYQLQLDGPLRWHVWPQLSILSGRMTLTARGATAPLVRADNMRLDVALLPLLSHQLHVKQVMLKGAVIQLTPQTEAVRNQNAPVAPKDNTLPDTAGERGWSFDVARLQVADSVLVFQHENDDLVTVRDINLQMSQDAHHRAEMDFSGRINRDQRDLSLSFSAKMDASDYPHMLTADLSQVEWQLQGADLPAKGISGQGSLQAQWQEEQKKLSFSQLNLTANDSALSGKGSVVLAEHPSWVLDLQFDTLNLDNLLAQTRVAADSGVSQEGQSLVSQPRPVIANNLPQADYQNLKGFSATFSLKANQILWRGMHFTQVSSEASNQRGLLSITRLQGSLNDGTLSLPGELDARSATPRITFQPTLNNVQIADILKAFDYPIAMTGKLSLAGNFTGSKIDADDFRHHWQGQAHIEMKDPRTEGLNFQQLVQQAVERSTNIQAQENEDTATQLDSVSSDLQLNNGQMSLANLQGQSDLMALTGQGNLDLVGEGCDMNFNVRVLSGWKGESKLVEQLKQTAIPLRIYGKWQALSYSLQVDQALRKQLQDAAKQRLNDWAERNKNTQNGKDVKKLLNQQ